jgi:3-oxoacyl-[acyl-carrier-protein] synthase-3
VDPAAIGALIFISQTPDYRVPPTSSVLHGRLGLKKECYCVDINDGCAGYIKGLFEASAFLAASDQEFALLVTADVLSPYVSVRDRNSYPLVGDAATITLLRKTAQADRMKIRIENDGRGAEALIIPAGGSRLPSSPATAEDRQDEDGNWRSRDHLVMRGGDVFAFTQSVVPAFISSFLRDDGRKAADFDYLFLHQASAFILDRLRRKLGVDAARLPDQIIRRYGNSSASTIPMGIALHVGIGRAVDALLCGFGIGLSWGAATVRLKDLQFCEIVEMEGT